jgi:hypothetical protein
METEEGKTAILAKLKSDFEDSDKENKGTLDIDGLWRYTEKLGANTDNVEGIMGHWNNEQVSYDALLNCILRFFGTDGRMTFDQWLTCMLVYMSKI